MLYHSVGNSIYRATQFQWAPSLGFHDPNPPILIEGFASGELTFTADGAVWSVGSSSLSGVSSSVDDLIFAASSAAWLVDVSVALSPQVDGPVLIGTSMVPQSLFGTG